MTRVSWLVTVSVLVVLALVVGCAPRPWPAPTVAPAPSAAGAPGPGAPEPLTVGARPPDLLFVIPPGTAAAQMRGEPAFTMPSALMVLTGQSVVIHNEDQAMHYFAETPIAPGQSYRKTFGRAGAFGYGGVLSCSIAESRTVTIRVVDELPARQPAAEPAAAPASESVPRLR